MTIVILDDARIDLVEGFRFYEQQGRGLGGYFLDSLFKDIDMLADQAGVHAVVFGEHRKLARRFPFGIYYTVADDEVCVHAVLDLRRNPHGVRDRLGG